MSDPVFDSLLIHRCTIRVRTKTGEDDFGQPVYSWSDEATSVPCRLASILSSGNVDDEILGAAQGGDEAYQAIIAQYKLYQRYSRALDSNNRVTDVTDKAGNLLDEAKDSSGNALTFEVRVPTDPAGQQHHRMSYLELITGEAQ